MNVRLRYPKIQMANIYITTATGADRDRGSRQSDIVNFSTKHGENSLAVWQMLFSPYDENSHSENNNNKTVFSVFHYLLFNLMFAF